ESIEVESDRVRVHRQLPRELRDPDRLGAHAYAAQDLVSSALVPGTRGHTPSLSKIPWINASGCRRNRVRRARPRARRTQSMRLLRERRLVEEGDGVRVLERADPLDPLLTAVARLLHASEGGTQVEPGRPVVVDPDIPDLELGADRASTLR